ncbi:hypothetical protein ACFLRY_04040, partial [Bacteroidota bacterium]
DCKLVQSNLVINDNEDLRLTYIESYCIGKEDVWDLCKRFQTRMKLQFCPNFVLPDTKLSIDEIMDKYDEEIFNGSN